MDARPHCVLHIGCPKTGTTSLQQFLTVNRELLLRQGVLYPRSLLERPEELLHTALASYAVEESRPRLRGEMFAAQRQQRTRLSRERLQAAFTKELALHAGKLKTLIFSNEHLGLLLLAEAELVRLKDLLAPHCCRLTVLVYLRRQDRIATSMYSTALRAGQGKQPMLPQNPVRMPHRPMYEYHRMLSLWSRVFGREQLQIRLYEDCRHRLLEDFCEVSGVQPGPEAEMLPPANTALSALGQAMLSRVNESRLFSEAQRLALVEVLDHRNAGAPALPLRAEAVAFYAHWRDTNERVRQDFLPARAAPLFDEDFSQYPLTAKEVVPVFDDALTLIQGLIAAGPVHASPEGYRIISTGSSKRIAPPTPKILPQAQAGRQPE
jgi:hypothetical protein